MQNLKILDYLADRSMLQYVSLDLGMLQSLNYYTGMILKVIYALGTPLFSGGRYDQVTCNFGADWPATGFSLSVDEALIAVERQNNDLMTIEQKNWVSPMLRVVGKKHCSEVLNCEDKGSLSLML